MRVFEKEGGSLNSPATKANLKFVLLLADVTKDKLLQYRAVRKIQQDWHQTELSNLPTSCNRTPKSDNIPVDDLFVCYSYQ